MSNLSGTNLAAKIVPFTTDDTYPTHDALYGKGGHREVATLVERDSIPEARRTLGMLVYVGETDDTYKLAAGGWTSFVVSGGTPTSSTSFVPVVSQASGAQEPSLVFEYNEHGHLDLVLEVL